MEKFPEYVYIVDSLGTSYVPGEPPSYYMPTKENGAWDYRDVTPRHLDETRFEEWKSTYYELEGWDPSTGRPKRAILESRGMKNVADELDSAGKLG
ncbi:MAG: aldehyde ferredoxin oxidoreductase C-terminal domain-containing protein [Dehalococcoidales bacterium]|nr:aldehyde ferredoxin oxidoreductase C-terminal domain-containing protein [Dehalococcoidales bacterium]